MFSPLENWLAARYLHIQTVIRKKKVYIAVTHTLGSLLPFVIIGSMLQAVSRSIFMQNGFLTASSFSGFNIQTSARFLYCQGSW